MMRDDEAEAFIASSVPDAHAQSVGMTTRTVAGKAGGVGPPTLNRPAYLLGVLCVVYMSSLVDRTILNIVAQAIKVDLKLTDTELGLLGGIAFSAVYALLAIPAARLAERKSRVGILAGAMLIWSLMTVVCGFAANFWQLAVARAGVGIGEAACTPCAHSMIGDTFPADRRATAISIYSLAIPVGTLVGVLGGAWLVEHYSWRAAFFAMGAPGVLVAAISRLTLKDPVRGSFSAVVSNHAPSIPVVLRHLVARPAFKHLLFGVTGSTVVNAGLASFIAPYLLRSGFGVGMTETALIIAGLAGGAAFVGTLVGGPLSDRLARRSPRYSLLLPAVAFLLAAPLWTMAFLSSSLLAFLLIAACAQIAASIYVGPTFGVLHNMVEPRMRATAVAIVFVATSLVGIGAGPLIIGAISDLSAATFYKGDFSASCLVSAQLTHTACRIASFDGLRIAMIVGGALHVLPALSYYFASRTLEQDLIEN